MARILIKHATGSKANRIEQFSIDSLEEISLGRDPGASITYDPEKDDLVSRRHALIRVHKGDELSFTIEDRQSSNGTLVNGERISAERELLPGDEVELGAGGPKFTFDVEPRPPHLMARTRMMTRAQETPELPPEPAAATTSDQPAPYKVGVGRSTVMNMLSDQLRSQLRLANRTWMYALAGVLALVAIVGLGLYYQNVVAAKRVTAKLAEVTDKMTAKQIAATHRESTVLIKVQWRLFDKESGKQVFHKYRPSFPGSKSLSPAYVRLKKDRSVVPWLMTNNEDQTNTAIMGEEQGSGFIVRTDGFILTNKHIAKPWEYYECDCNLNAGQVYEEDGDRHQWQRLDRDDLANWRLEGSSVLFDDKEPRRLKRDDKPFHARTEFLDVRLPGNMLSVEGRFVRAAADSDVALIRIDPPNPLKRVPLPDSEYKPILGEPVTVIGYPDVSSRKFALLRWIEGGEVRERAEAVPEPTVTEGIIANISGGIVHGDKDQNITMVGTGGEVYQLTVNTTGPGNSGGPVFNSDGKVIGLLTAMKRGSGGEIVTTATPIKYGLQILKLDRVGE